MDADSDSLWWALAIIDSAVGAGFFVFGIRQRAALPLLCGIALSVLPMLAPSGILELAITVLIGVAYVILGKYV